MAQTRTSVITIGLAEILVGNAAPNGTMPADMTKIGKTYENTCKIAQEQAEVTEHYEEGKAAPEIRKKKRKMPTVTFSIMDANVDDLVAYVGGTKSEAGEWLYDGNEPVENKAIRIKSEMGLDFDIPNGDIEAVINADVSSQGIFLVDFTVTPMAVTSGKALRGKPHTA